MPSPGRDRVFQAWVQRDGAVVPQPTFEVGEDGGGAVAVPDDLSDAEAVLVTREPRGGARAPSEPPLIRVPL
jgi:Anti-sigma-K factor rskA